MKRPGVVAIANEKVPIATVCQMLGVALPDGDAMVSRWKLRCPFGFTEHSDGGVEPAMRLYSDTNSAYCFACCRSYTPVAMAARGMDVPNRRAALHLLDRIGYRPPDLATVWQQAQQYEPPVDKAALADALKTYCRRTDAHWSARQFEPVVAETLTRCLELLDLVTTGDDVELWLTRCKEAMRRVLLTE